MKWELLPGEEVLMRESDDKFILSNMRVLIKERAAFKDISLKDISSMKIIREKSKTILIAGIISLGVAFYLMFFGSASNEQPRTFGFIFGIGAVLRYYTLSKRTLEFTLTDDLYTYKADNVLYGELISFVRAIEKAIGKENSTEIVDFSSKR